MRRAREEHRVLGRQRPRAHGSIVEFELRIRDDNVLAARILEDGDGSFGTPVRYRDDTHTWRAVDDLVGEALAHEAGTDDADADGPILICARLQCRIDDPHGLPPPPLNSPVNSRRFSCRNGHAAAIASDILRFTSFSISRKRRNA